MRKCEKRGIRYEIENKKLEIYDRGDTSYHEMMRCNKLMRYDKLQDLNLIYLSFLEILGSCLMVIYLETSFSVEFL